jgi:lipopolysaccharide assembly outer membrane protein LptD (OstA)
MKKSTLTTLLFVSCFTYCQHTAAQAVEKTDKKNRFLCQHAEFDPDTKKITLRENVRIELDELYLEADSAVFNDKDQTLLAYGTRKFTFKGGEAVMGQGAKNTIRYKFNDKIIYVE